MASSISKIIMGAMVVVGFSSCHERPVVLNVVDPGHFHASLLQKSRLEGVDEKVRVYAPEGEELEQYLATIEGYNTREQNPTSWKEDVYAGSDYLEHLPVNENGDVVMLAGNNAKKTDYILTAVERGYNVLSDKPLAIDSRGWDLLQRAYVEAANHNLVIYDLMTERYDIVNLIVKDILADPSIFGTFDYSAVPTVQMTSVHHFYKEVGGTPLVRPQWYYDVRQQGEGIADVTTHLIDLVFWQCFPQKTITTDKVEVTAASHYPTWISREQFARSTGAADFPDYLKGIERNGAIPVMSNGSLDFKVNGLPVQMKVLWNWTPQSGSSDTFEAVYKGDRSVVTIRQDASTGFVKQISMTTNLEYAANRLRTVLGQKYPGTSLKEVNGEYVVVIPSDLRIGHEDHFNMVAAQFLKYIRGEEQMPEWESQNTLSKYYITTKAVEMASAK